jgi:hypothetical protein
VDIRAHDRPVSELGLLQRSRPFGDGGVGPAATLAAGRDLHLSLDEPPADDEADERDHQRAKRADRNGEISGALHMRKQPDRQREQNRHHPVRLVGLHAQRNTDEVTQRRKERRAGEQLAPGQFVRFLVRVAAREERVDHRQPQRPEQHHPEQQQGQAEFQQRAAKLSGGVARTLQPRRVDFPRRCILTRRIARSSRYG